MVGLDGGTDEKASKRDNWKAKPPREILRSKGLRDVSTHIVP